MRRIPVDRLHPLAREALHGDGGELVRSGRLGPHEEPQAIGPEQEAGVLDLLMDAARGEAEVFDQFDLSAERSVRGRSEEHTSELQSLMRISYAVFCLKKKKNTIKNYRRQKHNKQHNSQ